MNNASVERKPVDSTELSEEQGASRSGGCPCNTTRTSGRLRWVIGPFVLVVAGILAVRPTTNADDGASAHVPASEIATRIAVEEKTVAPVPAPIEATSIEPAETNVGTIIGWLSELNATADDAGAVFMFLPGEGGSPSAPPSTAMKSAAEVIESQAGIKCGIFTLKVGTQDYDQLSKKMTVPGVLVLVKGSGGNAVSGEVTESKLVQGFMAASSPGGCSSGGCGAGGCN